MKNVGRTDRGLRIAAAVLLGAFVLVAGGTGGALINWILAAVALVFLATAFFGTCPLYRILGIKTCRSS